MLGYIMFFAAVLFSLSMEIYGFNEACTSFTKALFMASIVLTAVFSAVGFIVCLLIEKGVIKL